MTDFHVGGVAVINSQKFLLARKTLMEVLQRVQSHAKQLDLIRRQPKQSVAESTRTLHMRNRKARTVGIQSYTIIYNCPIIQPSSTINWYQYPPTPGNRRGRVRDKVPFRRQRPCRVRTEKFSNGSSEVGSIIGFRRFFAALWSHAGHLQKSFLLVRKQRYAVACH